MGSPTPPSWLMDCMGSKFRKLMKFGKIQDIQEFRKFRNSGNSGKGEFGGQTEDGWTDNGF